VGIYTEIGKKIYNLTKEKETALTNEQVKLEAIKLLSDEERAQLIQQQKEAEEKAVSMRAQQRSTAEKDEMAQRRTGNRQRGKRDTGAVEKSRRGDTDRGV